MALLFEKKKGSKILKMFLMMANQCGPLQTKNKKNKML
jgi:hypothetical protein